jgi:Tfp pilus assembly protein PilF
MRRACLAALLIAVSGCASRGPALLQAPMESQIARTRAVAQQAAPRSARWGLTVESWDPRLQSALADLSLGETAERLRRVAAEYRRLGILDVAHAHLTKAVEIAPDDAAAHDGLARIWRDWGFPHLGLANGHRAVQLAPESPIAANTLGTMYAATGRFGEAHAWYAKALTLAPEAPYALNNYCYSAVRLGRADAIHACEQAAAAQPESTAVRNNLGLAYAAAGDIARASEQFSRAGKAEAFYNLGIVHLAQGRFAQARAAFAEALRERPTFRLAAARARQSQALIVAQEKRQDDGH